MRKIIRYFTFLLTLCTSMPGLARLEFDSQANKVQLYGPYIKYNTLKEPYSLGRYQIDLTDIRLESVSIPTATIESPENESKTEQKIVAVWPRFLMSFGRLQLISKNKRTLLEETFQEENIGSDEKFARFELEGEGEALLETLNEPFQICVYQEFESSKVTACSNFLKYTNGTFSNTFVGKNSSSAKLNDQQAPKNAQISIAGSTKKISLEIQFISGFSIKISDKVRHLKLKNLAIDPRKKRLGIIDGDGAVRPTSLTLKDRLFSFIKERNYFKNAYASSTDWPQDLQDAEMEFSPYQTGASLQLYGIILPNVPPPFSFNLSENIPIATYAKTIEITGTKKETEVLAARVKNELFIHDNQKEFLWIFPTKAAGEINQNYLSLQYKGKDYYFSKRIFRAHHSSVSGAIAISTSATLDIVPGYNLSAEHWFESIWNKSKYSFQRWGIMFNHYATDKKGFKPSKEYPEKISVNPMNFDILFRFTPGVRPVQSSFGVGLRYLKFKLFRSRSDDIETQFLGIGSFWHTAPQKIVDDIFNVVPFFRYPKWMELSFFYYPLLLGPEKAGFSFSWQARGKMFFSKNWYFDASFNVNHISFQKPKLAGVTLGADAFAIGTAHGTLGVGYLFN